MIELPESIVLSRQLTNSFAGRIVGSVEAAHTPHGFAFFANPAEDFPLLLEGKILTKVIPVGGHVDLIFGDLHLVLNDGVNIRALKPDEGSPEKHQFLLRFEDSSGFYVTVSMYGGFALYPKGKSDNIYYLAGKSKPSPLSDSFDKPYFKQLFEEASGKLSIKAFLATEQRIPGLGNGVLQDILFNAQINPQMKLNVLSEEQLLTLYRCIKETLKKMTEDGGRNTEKNLFNEFGGYKTMLSNKTKDQPCPRCGSKITKKSYLGGSIYFCSKCQPL